MAIQSSMRGSDEAPLVHADRLPIGVFACEFDVERGEFALRYHNEQLADVAGVNPHELAVDPAILLRAVNRRSRARLLALLRNATPEGCERKADLRLGYGTPARWLEMRALVNRVGESRYAVSGCCWDISKRKRRERAAIGRRDRLGAQWTAQAQSMPIAMIVTSADAEMTVKEWNPAAEKIFGFSREEMIGQPAMERIVLPEDRTFVIDAAMPGPRGAEGNVGRSRNVRKDGAVIWCRWINTPIVDAAGAVQGLMCLARDISDEIQNEERLRLWGSVIQHSSEAIIICDAEQRIVQVNRAFEEITGYAEAEAVGHTPRILQSGKHGREFYRQMWREVAERGQWRGEIWNRRKNGDLYAEWLALGAVRNAAGAIAHYVGIFSDITARKQIEERVRYLSRFDALTDLPNRTQCVERVAEALERARRERKKLALLLVDLDRFKTVNDSMGHDAGDELLVRIADRLRNLLRVTDVVARMGGDEFAVLLPDVESAHAVAAVARKVLACLRAPMILRNQELSVSGSVGVCVFPGDAQDAGELIRNADAAMYHAKDAGRNDFRFYSPDMNERALETLATEAALRRAIERDEFVLHYQPQVDIRTGATVGLEALIRWRRPNVGLVMPGQFIPIAEDRGLIGAIGAWTLRECVRQAAEWDRDGVEPLPIAVNLSANEFHQPGFADRVEQVLAQHGVRPERIELEITEGVIVRDAKATIEILERLHRLGVRLSIDDFGTGYSSLNYLRRFPIDKIKIDQSFVREMLSDRGAAGIVRGIVELAKSLELEVIAEGVETDMQLRFLAEARCDVVQGFLFSRGLPVDELRRWLRARSSALEAGDRDAVLMRASA